MKVGVIGLGLMGGGIAQVCAQAGHAVLAREINAAFLEKGLGKIQAELEKLVAKEKITTGQKEEIVSRIKGTLALEDFKDCDLIIEAVTEDIELKKEVFRALDTVSDPKTIFASNTSSIPIIQLAVSTKRSDRFLGLHFFNPVPRMQLVEIVKTISVSEETTAKAREFVLSLGKTPIIAKDRAGFVVNLLLIPYLLDAIRTFESGFASKEDIDTGMVLGCNYPMGPLRLLDYLGLDTAYFVANIMYEEFKDPKFAPPPLLKQMVTAGLLGVKSGKGFYDYAQR